MTSSTGNTDRQTVEEFWAETEARAERRGVTEPTRSLTPNCPEWCTVTHRVGDLDFELDEHDALRRYHCGRNNVVEESQRHVPTGQRPSVVEWWLSVSEYLDGSLGPVEVSMDVAGSPFLSPDRARKVARGLLEAADQADRTDENPPTRRVNLNAHAPAYREADEKHDPAREQDGDES